MRRPCCAICGDWLELAPEIATPLGDVHIHCEATAILETIPSFSMEPTERRRLTWELGLERGYL
jgi:hypothetical protein